MPPSREQTLGEALARAAQGRGPGVPGPLPQIPTSAAVRPSPAPPVVTFPIGSLYPHVAPLASFTPFTYEEAKLPSEDLYDPSVSPQRPYTFDVCRYQVPQFMALLILGYEFGAQRVGGVDPFDTIPLEPGRMKQSWIWDFNVGGDRSNRNTTYQILPTPVVQRGAGTGLPQAVAANAFAATQARLDQQGGGAGLAGLPFDGRMYGPDNAPFTALAQQGQTVAIRVSVIRPLGVPLASISGRIDGYLLPVTELAKLNLAIQPPK